MHPHIAKKEKFTRNNSANFLRIILQASKHGLNTEQFKFLSESFYQISLLLFSGKEGLTRYKFKMLLIPQIMDAVFVRSPWHHMCEAMENSNHHAHKDFQTKTMRGRGNLYNLDPLFYEASTQASETNRADNNLFRNMQKCIRACNKRNRCHSRFK